MGSPLGAPASADLGADLDHPVQGNSGDKRRRGHSQHFHFDPPGRATVSFEVLAGQANPGVVGPFSLAGAVH